ncbi:DUF6176 family protein [Microbacterium protaetiae]|nr:DUF6176 family protein [Microbacterium protaetiae]
MRIELTRFRIREGAGARVDEWMAFLNENMDAVRVQKAMVPAAG